MLSNGYFIIDIKADTPNTTIFNKY